jgi:molybdopterin-guanine dinucleotide biosynthesis protein B
MIAGPERWALMTELQGPAPRLGQLLTELAPCDLVLVEGFRSEGSIPRIEVRGPAFAPGADAPGVSASLPSEARSAKEGSAKADGAWVAADDPDLIAVVCDDPVDGALPRFGRDDVAAVATFIVQRLGVER